MKRAAIIVGVVLCISVVVGAFIVGGGDNASEAKGPTTTAKQSNAVEDATKAITNAGTKVASEAPKNDDDNKSDDEGKPGKYEISKASVRVSPPTLRQGKELKIEVKNFQPGEQVLITVTPAAGGSPVISKTITVKKNNQGKLEIDKPNLPTGAYTVSATGLTSTGFASTNLTVVKKSS